MDHMGSRISILEFAELSAGTGADSDAWGRKIVAGMLVKQAPTPAPATHPSADSPLTGLSERESEAATTQSAPDVQAVSPQNATALARYKLGCDSSTLGPIIKALYYIPYAIATVLGTGRLVGIQFQ